MKSKQQQINEQMEAHAKIANEEMGHIKESMAVVENDIKWLKETLKLIDARTWYILTGIIMTILVQIALQFIK